jgi:hypothetical protein
MRFATQGWNAAPRGRKPSPYELRYGTVLKLDPDLHFGARVVIASGDPHKAKPTGRVVLYLCRDVGNDDREVTNRSPYVVVDADERGNPIGDPYVVAHVTPVRRGGALAARGGGSGRGVGEKFLKLVRPAAASPVSSPPSAVAPTSVSSSSPRIKSSREAGDEKSDGGVDRMPAAPVPMPVQSDQESVSSDDDESSDEQYEAKQRVREKRDADWKGNIQVREEKPQDRYDLRSNRGVRQGPDNMIVGQDAMRALKRAEKSSQKKWRVVRKALTAVVQAVAAPAQQHEQTERETDAAERKSATIQFVTSNSAASNRDVDEVDELHFV